MLLIYVVASCTLTAKNPAQNEVNLYCPNDLNIVEIYCYSIGDKLDQDQYYTIGFFRYSISSREITKDSLETFRMSDEFVIYPFMNSYNCEFYMASRDTLLLAKEKKEISRQLITNIRKFADLTGNCCTDNHDSSGIFLISFDQDIWNPSPPFSPPLNEKDG
ncbi:hypothetical protein GCM10011318_09150 [Phaeocystidibacter marisrubri]|nr:hypothetical protein GCM10011318_09150 [Phaeocystidibacter marisrubri]